MKDAFLARMRTVRRARNVVAAAGGPAAVSRYALRLLRTEGVAGLWSRVARHVLGTRPVGSNVRGDNTEARAALVSQLTLLNATDGSFMNDVGGTTLASGEAPTVSVMLIHRQGARLARETLIALQRASVVPESIEFGVIGCGEADAALDPLPGLRRSQVRSEADLLDGIHAFAQELRGEFVLLTTDAVQAQAGAIDALVRRLRTDVLAAAACAAILRVDATLIESGASWSPDGTFRRLGEGDDASDPSYSVSRRVPAATDLGVLIRRDVLLRAANSARTQPRATAIDALMRTLWQSNDPIVFEPEARFACQETPSAPAPAISVSAKSDRSAAPDALARAASDIRVLAFYLPQYHPIRENDEWWGKGFTEWTNVSKARPNFEGHYQPHLPADLGFYDLRVPEVRQAQADLARNAGLAGFCYYYYWFSGHRLLERPLQEVLDTGKPNFPFCICWANENWTRRWDGLESSLLIGQSYTQEDEVALFRDWLPLLRDERYIRVNGKPLVLIYRISLLPEPRRAAATWRRMAREAGLGDVYLAYVQSFDSWARGEKPADFDFDASVEFPPHGCGVPFAGDVQGLASAFRGALFDYQATAEVCLAKPNPGYPMFRGTMPSWDNTARKQNTGHIFLGASPEAYEAWLDRALSYTDRFACGDERIVFVNAWNEWGEGNHLEPDMRYKHAFLDATRRAISRWTHRPA
ncbi:glycoside hydrolase family 99-like domain-containing protein [Caballeronia grimmiae]|uniref:Glycosyl hydrolase n=1 Tax=Caballeronia grimmiae TaxID=1071679 RepID=A0A069PJD2_9BURK|nr:glycoside hydrolase family 99-like domain-containing protein [Caballeronia grimmiae]KDR37446.1 glycosyl hydrolase [Caballeronia grimmiae]GGD69307.1 hypothetical protein GCM10010985_24740 [Caballeronia grimmiae]